MRVSSAHNCSPCDGCSMENKTNDIKDQFVQDYYDGKKPTLVQYLSLYSGDMDVDEFLDWGLAFAMLHAKETYIKKYGNKL